MADNIDVTPGTGKTIAADEIGGSLHQRIKLVIGNDGVNDGDVSASNPLPITGTISAVNDSVDANGGSPPASSTSIGFDNIGTFTQVSAAFPLPIYNAGGDLSVTIASELGTAGHSEDSTSANGDVGIPAMAIRKATPANLSGTDGDYEMLQMSAGRLWTEAIIEDGGNSITVDGTVTANLGTIGAAATAAKQPALGTAGTASADVITIQGIASGTVVPVSDGGGSLTVDGAISFTAPQHVIVDSGTVTTVSTVTTITNVVHVDDNSGSLTVDGTLKTGYGTATAFTKTNANLAASVTAGWKSNAIDNTSTKALDALIGIELAAVNTAPAGTKMLYLYAYGLIEGTAYTSTGDGTIDGTEGTVTFPSVTTLPVVLRLIGIVPYPVQNKAINGGPFSVAAAFGGILPDKWGVAMVNDTGMTLSVTNFFYQEITNTLG